MEVKHFLQTANKNLSEKNGDCLDISNVEYTLLKRNFSFIIIDIFKFASFRKLKEIEVII